MIINENSFIHKFMEKHSKCIDESYDRYLKKCEYYENLPEDDSDENENCEKTVESPTKNTVGNTQSNDENEATNEDVKDTSVEEPQDTNDNKSVFNKLKGGEEKNKQKAFKLFAGLMKDAEGGDENNQHKEEYSSEATVSYQPAVANNLFGNTGVTNQITFSPASEFRTVEERISELRNQLMMETDRNKIVYIANQIINLVPDKERFMKILLSKLK